MKELIEKLKKAKNLLKYQSSIDALEGLNGIDQAIQALSQSNWIKVEDGLPEELETVWISNGKGWTTLGCRVCFNNGWHWAATNGVIYEERGKIVSECESDDLDVKFWQPLPTPPNE